MLENRNDTILLGDVARDTANDIISNSESSQLNDFRSEVRGFGLGDIGRADHFIGHHVIHDADARGLGFGLGLVNLLRRDEPEVRQHVH